MKNQHVAIATRERETAAPLLARRPDIVLAPGRTTVSWFCSKFHMTGMGIRGMDDIQFAPPKKPWHDDSPATANILHGFNVVQDSVHPHYHSLLMHRSIAKSAGRVLSDAGSRTKWSLTLPRLALSGKSQS